MLEIRYNKSTRLLTGWCADSRQFGNLADRGNEGITILDIPIPDKKIGAWLFDGQKLIPNPDYAEPLPPRNLEQEIDAMRAQVANFDARLKIDIGGHIR